ncbi:hypothetical protein ACSSTO_03015 [Bacillus atrophaeus]|uniref:hypothetical protein n=1 Tax=Bacillus atrophaeus TaxID=1452 RepID=UPI003ED9F3AD
MSRNRFYENEDIPSDLLDTSLWPKVLVDQLDESSKSIFLTRKQAVELYLKNEKTLNEIRDLTGITRANVRKYTKRCLETDKNNKIWGFRALIPFKTTRTYQRKNLKSESFAGLFQQLLDTYPLIDDIIHDYCKKNNHINNKVLHKKFLDACRSVGLTLRDYPFNTETRSEVIFFYMKAERTIQGNKENGKRPHINYEGVKYYNEILSRSFELIGTKLTILVNTEDLRIVKAFLPDGSEFGMFTAFGKWGVTPHDLKTRKMINKLRKRKMIHLLQEDDPIDVLTKHLEKEARKNKNSRNTLATLNRYIETHQSTNDVLIEPIAKADFEQKKNNNNVPYNKNKPSDIKSRRLTKTIMY